jgi:type II secretory pathway component PulF
MEISRFARTLATLLGNGVAILPSLEVVKQTLNNQVLKNEVNSFQSQVREGSSLAASIKKSQYFPIFVTNIVAVGEESGLLEKSLLRVADAYEREVDRVIKTMTTLLEPVIILIMGSIVGFIVISILLPIFQINLIAR